MAEEIAHCTFVEDLPKTLFVCYDDREHKYHVRLFEAPSYLVTEDIVHNFAYDASARIASTFQPHWTGANLENAPEFVALRDALKAVRIKEVRDDEGHIEPGVWTNQWTPRDGVVGTGIWERVVTVNVAIP